MFESLTEFWFVFRFGFRASLSDFTSCRKSSGYTFAITVQMYEVFRRILVANTVAHVHRQATGRSYQVTTACVSQFL